MNDNWFEQKQHGVLIVILLGLAYCLLMFGNGIVSLTHPDEVFYIESAKDMLRHNSWLTPMIFDEVQFEKPFLAFSLFMLAIKAFGLTAFAGRFWPSLFGIIGVISVYWIAWTLFKRKKTAFLSGFILSSSFIYIALSRAVLTDMIFSVMVTVSIGCFALAYYDRRYKHAGILLWLAVSGIAVLTKGILGFTFPVTTALVFLCYKKDFSFLKCSSTAWGILAFTVIAVPWHILMYSQHGTWFLEEYFYNVHWRRILMSEHARLDNWHFYLMLMVVGIMPWFLFWIPAGQGLYLQFKKKMASREKLFFLVGWIVSIYIFVQPAHSKLASYIFPAFPAIVIIIAFFINDALDKLAAGDRAPLFKLSAHLMSIILIGVAIGGIIAAKMYSDIVLDMRPIYFAAATVMGLSCFIFIFNRKEKYIQMVLLHIALSFILIGALFFARPFIEPWVSCKDITDIFKKIDSSNTPILASKFYVRGVRFYTDRSMAVIDINGKGFWSPHPIPFLNKDSMVIDFLNQRDVTWAIVKEGNVKDLERILRGLKYKINYLDGIGGKFILKIEKIS